ncbi:hypothetical protein N7532_008907 [Penicillium argentinense]|uniref:Uncharacterized protein n=1 Tax=Penicillium argentinense TaxID=1131581 RepID=A0A9W9K242_9EURO|nr:uncharacterized protein N7532_008907 [Penicillium argentinense]KAJ5090223.1 hypothetical protein N7532_008907 [Penicillium argentinense]
MAAEDDSALWVSTIFSTLQAMAIACLASLCLYYPCWVVYTLFLHPLSVYPGPKLAAITPLVHLLWDIQGKQHAVMKDLHDKYGDVVRIAPNALCYRASSAWKDIYGHRKRGQPVFLKDPSLYAPTPNGVNAIITANEEDHTRMRRLLTHAFSNKALLEQESLLHAYADMLIDKLAGLMGDHCAPVVDMTRWFNFTTFDLIGDLAFGEPFDCLTNNQYHWWVMIILDAVKASAYLKVFFFYPILLPLLALLVPKHLLQKREDSFALSVEKMRRRLKSGTTRPDFTSYIIKHSKDGRSLTPEEIDANAAVFVLAGSETTAALLSGCVYYLLRYRDKYLRLAKEIRGAFNKPSDIKLAAITELPYLNAVLTETLRIYPPIPSMLPRIVPDGGAYIDGEFVPAGSARFIDDNKEAFQPFSYGPRNCLGQHLANAEMRLIMTKLLWHFDLDLLEECRNWSVQKTYSLWSRPALNVALYRAGSDNI